MPSCTKMEKIAVVTGANRGIGFEIVKGLCEKFNGVVYLTARDVKKGEEAVKKLKDFGLNPLFHQLDITDKRSIKIFKEHVFRLYGGIDLLINNAGIAYKEEDTKPFIIQAENTLKVNYFGTLDVCTALFPILRKNGRVVNLSSCVGHLSRIQSVELQAKLGDPNLSTFKLNNLMKQFLQSARKDATIGDGWGSSPYAISKVGISALTRIQQRDFDIESPFRNISVNCCHPGYVATEMNNYKGSLSPEEGTRSTLFLALKNHNLKGQFLWQDCRSIDWTKL